VICIISISCNYRYPSLALRAKRRRKETPSEICQCISVRINVNQHASEDIIYDTRAPKYPHEIFSCLIFLPISSASNTPGKHTQPATCIARRSCSEFNPEWNHYLPAEFANGITQALHRARSPARLTALLSFVPISIMDRFALETIRTARPIWTHQIGK